MHTHMIFRERKREITDLKLRNEGGIVNHDYSSSRNDDGDMVNAFKRFKNLLD